MCVHSTISNQNACTNLTRDRSYLNFCIISPCIGQCQTTFSTHTVAHISQLRNSEKYWILIWILVASKSRSVADISNPLMHMTASKLRAITCSVAVSSSPQQCDESEHNTFAALLDEPVTVIITQHYSWRELD